MFRPYQQNQEFLLPPSLSDFIDENHPAHMINDLVDLVVDANENARRGLTVPAGHQKGLFAVIKKGVVYTHQ